MTAFTVGTKLTSWQGGGEVGVGKNVLAGATPESLVCLERERASCKGSGGGRVCGLRNGTKRSRKLYGVLSA